MQQSMTVDQIVQLARQLPPLERLKLVQSLASELQELRAESHTDLALQDDQYQRGYERIPEDVADLASLLPHLPIPAERWE